MTSPFNKAHPPTKSVRLINQKCPHCQVDHERLLCEAGQHVRVLRITLPRDKSLAQSKRLILKKIHLFEATRACPSAVTIDVDPS